MSKRHGHAKRLLLSAPYIVAAVAASPWLAAAAASPLHAQAKAMKADAKAPAVQVVAHEGDRRVDITVDGKPFTSYIWPTTLKKPVLFPLRSAAGTELTRGFPPRQGERADHPHHVGLWLNYGDVDGFDFWNNSDAIPAADAPKMGTIQQRAIVSAKSGAGRGELEVATDWIEGDNTLALTENTKFTFLASGSDRIIDRVTTLTAPTKAVTFGDSKEGVFGMRVRRQLEDPLDKSTGIFTDASGRATKVEAMDTTGVTGAYLTSEGKKGGEAWGTRGRWCALSGTVDNEAVTIVIFDHPKNPNAPTYWHARGYGLFAANPLGGEQFDKTVSKRSLTVQPKAQLRFIYRVLLLHGSTTAAEIETRYNQFLKDLQ
jgi:hypothetical protein